MDYELIFNSVKTYLQENNGEFVSSKQFPFRKRSEHIWRVFSWAKRLLDYEDFSGPINTVLDRDAV